MVGFVLAAAILQVLATIKLGLAPLDALERVAHASPVPYLVASFGLGCAALLAWLLRARPVVAGSAVVVVGAILTAALWNRVSWLGFAFRGEYVLHHFATLLSAAACLHVTMAWIRRPWLGHRRLVPAVLLGAGVLAMLAVHLHGQPLWRGPWRPEVQALATALLLAGPITALALFWSYAEPTAYRDVSAVLLSILVLRVALAGWGGLEGASVPAEHRTLLVGAVVFGAMFVFLRFRPVNPAGVRSLVVLLAAVATGLLYLMYQRSFGLLEDGIGGLAHSLFAFPLPYPEYVARWRVVVVVVALFAMFVTVYGGLMAYEERTRGATLGLMLVTGLGLSNAQLVLMTTAAQLVWLESLLCRERSVGYRAPARPIGDILQDLADATGWTVVTLDTAHGLLTAVRGDLASIAVDVRAKRVGTERWKIRLRVGVPGRSPAEIELRPDTGHGGLRPTHALARTHRILGSVRALEGRGDALLDALLEFPRARAKLWPAGSEVELGDDLTHLEAAVLQRLLRAMTEPATH